MKSSMPISAIALRDVIAFEPEPHISAIITSCPVISCAVRIRLGDQANRSCRITQIVEVSPMRLTRETPERPAFVHIGDECVHEGVVGAHTMESSATL